MKHWRALYREEVGRLEFSGKAELLEQIESAGEAQRYEWLEGTQAALAKVREGLLSAMLETRFEELIDSADWQKAQQELHTLVRLEAALQGRDPEQAIRRPTGASPVLA